MSRMMAQMMGTALLMVGSYKTNQREWKDRILKQWIESADYPRKKKKRARRKLNLEWGIACWDPMGLDKFSFPDV